MEYGEKIKELRMRLGLSQSAFAAKLGIHKQMVSDVERGKQKRFNPQIEQKIVELFDLEPSFFLSDQRTDQTQRSVASFSSLPAEEEILLRYYAQIPENRKLDALVCLLECIKKYK